MEMSHQTGIVADADVLAAFTASKGGETRLIKLVISADSSSVLRVTADSVEPVNRDWEDDYESMVVNAAEESKPCYMLFRLDTTNNLGYEWLFISWTPDDSPARLKLLYSATRPSIKEEFGGEGLIKHELFATVVSELSLKGFKESLEWDKAPAPLTEAEEEIKEIKKAEANPDISVNTKQQAHSGVFALTADAMDKISLFRDRSINYVQLELGSEDESTKDKSKPAFQVSDHGSIHVDELQTKIPKDHGRFHLYYFEYEFKSQQFNKNVFIYSMPADGPPREKIMYSSCKRALSFYLDGQVQLNFKKYLEVDSGSKVTKDALLNELHPPGETAK